MSLRFAPYEDRSSWELFVLRHAPQAVFHSWMWGEVQSRTGATVLRYGVYDGNELLGVIQMVLVRARRGSFLHVRHGPVLCRTDAKLWRSVIAFLSREAVSRGCWFVRMNPLLPDSEEMRERFRSLGAKPSAMHRMDGEYCWVLDLGASTDELLAGMRKTTRYEIKRAAKEGVEVFSTTDAKYLTEFFNLYAATSSRQGFVPHNGIREEFQVFAKKNQAMLYLGKYEGKTVAAAIILYYGNQAVYHHGASQTSKVPVSAAVQWEAIRNAKDRGMNVYNFWGIAPDDSPKHPWRGLTLFKKGFGGRLVEYIHAQDIPVSPWYWLTHGIELVRKLLRGYD